MALPAQQRDIAISGNANLNLLLNHYCSVNADGDIVIKDYENFIRQLEQHCISDDQSKEMMNQFQTILQMAIDADKKPDGFQG